METWAFHHKMSSKRNVWYYKVFSAMSDGFIHENSYADDIKGISCYISEYQNIEYHPIVFQTFFSKYSAIIDFNF